ncbi:GDSL-type esterase/lipase family protein [Paenibacillaceae bacterium WGS1546]|uniref:GDSL-type esterase/lipase family protein n=1 Tax=Cohnella sp. WGS1546 TaxID=3366810 RepID=UPI00372D59B3
MKSSSSWQWRALGVTTLVCLAVMLTGFGWALKDHWFPQSGLAVSGTERPDTATGGDWNDKPELYVAAVGDSLTKGTGDATGEGYVSRVVNRLSQELDKPVRLVNNMAVNGMRADQLVEAMDGTGFVNAIARADIVLMTIGGNDLFQAAQDGGSIAQGGDISPEALRERLPEVEPRLKEAFEKIRSLNPHARIVYIGLYNAFYDMPAIRREAGEIVARWNEHALSLAMADGNATVVPTYDLFEIHLGKYLSSDHFHPNEDGYARMAERVVQALR